MQASLGKMIFQYIFQLQTKMKQRLLYIDEMRGLAILLVTIGHRFFVHTSEGACHPTNQAIYSFHMAFFFFLSGFMLAKTHNIQNLGFKGFFKKKFISLILPWLSWTLIIPWYIIHGLSYNLECFNRLLFFPNVGYWFLPVLFLFMIVWAVVYLLFSSNQRPGGGKSGRLVGYLLICILMSVIGVITRQYFLLIYSIYFLCFVLGESISIYERLECFIQKKIIVGCCALLLLLCWKLGPLLSEGNALKSMLNVIYNLICSVSACIVLYNVFKTVKLPRFLAIYLSETGKYSLSIYLIPVVIFPLSLTLPSDWSVSAINISIILIALCDNTVRYLLGRVINEIPVIRYILMGKK